MEKNKNLIVYKILESANCVASGFTIDINTGVVSADGVALARSLPRILSEIWHSPVEQTVVTFELNEFGTPVRKCTLDAPTIRHFTNFHKIFKYICERRAVGQYFQELFPSFQKYLSVYDRFYNLDLQLDFENFLGNQEKFAEMIENKKFLTWVKNNRPNIRISKSLYGEFFVLAVAGPVLDAVQTEYAGDHKEATKMLVRNICEEVQNEEMKKWLLEQIQYKKAGYYLSRGAIHDFMCLLKECPNAGIRFEDEFYYRYGQLKHIYESTKEIRKQQQLQKVRDYMDKHAPSLPEESDYIIIVPKTQEEFTDEGAMNQNCVSGYYLEHCMGRRLVIFIRRKDNPGQSCITCEVQGRNIRQFSGKYNSTNITIEQREIKDYLANYFENHPYTPNE